jgi:hypothetical protein
VPRVVRVSDLVLEGGSEPVGLCCTGHFEGFDFFFRVFFLDFSWRFLFLFIFSHGRSGEIAGPGEERPDLCAGPFDDCDGAPLSVEVGHFGANSDAHPLSCFKALRVPTAHVAGPMVAVVGVAGAVLVPAGILGRDMKLIEISGARHCRGLSFFLLSFFWFFF